MRRIARAVVHVLVVVMCASGLTIADEPSPAQAAEITPNGSIVVQTAKNGVPGLYVVPPGCEYAEGDTSDSNASCLVQLTDNAADRDPAWDPTGQEIAFSREGSIYSLHVATGSIKRLTTSTSDRYPAWSPDGLDVAFSRIASVPVADSPPCNASVIVTVTRFGSDETVVPGPRTTAGGDLIHRSQPTYSPDGSEMAYTRELGEPTSCTPIVTGNIPIDAFLQIAGLDGIYETDVAVSSVESHSDESLITFAGFDFSSCEGTGLVAICPGDAAFAPDWSPDGSRLVVATRSESPSPDNGLWLVSPNDDTVPVLLTTSATYSDAPNWSTEGDFIVVDGIEKYDLDGNRIDTGIPGGDHPDVQCVPDTCLYGGIFVAKEFESFFGGSASFDYTGAVEGTIEASEGVVSPGSLFGAASDPNNSVTEISDLPLVSISCDGQNAVGDLASMTANIVLERGEYVTCVFVTAVADPPDDPPEDPGDPGDGGDTDPPGALCGTDPDTYNGGSHTASHVASVAGIGSEFFTLDLQVTYCWNGEVSAIRSATIAGDAEAGFAVGALSAIGLEPRYIPKFDSVVISPDGATVDMTTRFSMCIDLLDVVDRVGISDKFGDYLTSRAFAAGLRRVSSPAQLGALLDDAFNRWAGQVHSIHSSMPRIPGFNAVTKFAADVAYDGIDHLRDHFIDTVGERITPADIEAWTVDELAEAVAGLFAGALSDLTTVCDLDTQVLWEPEFSFTVMPNGTWTDNFGGYSHPSLFITQVS